MIQKYTFADGLFQVIRLTALFMLQAYGYVLLTRLDKAATTSGFWLLLAALFGGSIVYLLIMQIFYFVMGVALKCQPLGNHDF